MYIHKFRSEVMNNLRNQIEKLTIFHIRNTPYKYKQKCTITKIANDLDMDISTVIEGLNLLTSLIEE